MITDQVSKCPYCGSTMKIDSFGGWTSCPDEELHKPHSMWCLYNVDDNGRRNLRAINIEQGGYQLCWHMRDSTTELLCLDAAHKDYQTVIMTLPELMDFELTPEVIGAKIKLLLTWM